MWYPLKWSQARAALEDGEADEVEGEHDRYAYRLDSRRTLMVLPFGAMAWCVATYEPHKNSMFRVSIRKQLSD